MNERIKELANKYAFSKEPYEKIKNKAWTDVYNEKFAELIVQECCSIAENQRSKVIENPDDPSWTEHFVDVQTNIKNKFGIYF